SGFQGCWLRGSRGSSDTTFAMVGEARLTAHGSAGAALPGWAATGTGGAVMEGVSDVVLACGVFATVESPEPQPANVTAIKATAAEPVSRSVRHGSDHTSTHRTVIGSAGVAGVAGTRSGVLMITRTTPPGCPAALSSAELPLATRLLGR